MEYIYYDIPDDCMILVNEESVKLIKEQAREHNLTTNRLIIKSGLDKSVIEGLYYGRHRIRLSYLRTLCEVIFGADQTDILKRSSNIDI